MTPGELRAMRYFARGDYELVCDSYNDVTRVRRWMEEHYPKKEIWVRGNESGRRIRVRSRDRPP